MPDILNILTCPACGGRLTRCGSSLVCLDTERHHTYDIARSGYVNLLPPGRGRNSRTGDDADMVHARVKFLSLGMYDRLSDEATRLIDIYAPEGDVLTLIDSGCGEGYHTRRIARAVSRPISVAAFDASKRATDLASRVAVSDQLSPHGGIGMPPNSDTSRNIAFITGNIFSLPVKDSSADAVLSMFAPIAWAENLRILRPGGITVVASSGSDHLIELRSVIYDHVIKKESAPAAEDGFSEISCTNVRYSIHLPDTESIIALFRMTPFSHRTSEGACARLTELPELDVTVDTDFRVFRKERVRGLQA